METCTRNQTIARYRPPGIVPLELWDLIVDGRVLWEIMTEPDFPEVLCQIIGALRQGEGETRSEGRVPDVIAGFDSVHIAGGRSREPLVRSAMGTLELPVTFSGTPDYPAQSEGLRLIGDLGGRTGWLCDLGQSTIKLSTKEQPMSFHRDLRRLPIRTGHPNESVPKQRVELRDWLAESLRCFSAKAAAPDAILFALPSRLDDQAVPEGSSYIGMAGDENLVADAVGQAGLNPPRILVLNDAELAALEAFSGPSLQHSVKTLVLTLGFGLGAALAIRGGIK